MHCIRRAMQTLFGKSPEISIYRAWPGPACARQSATFRPARALIPPSPGPSHSAGGPSRTCRFGDNADPCPPAPHPPQPAPSTPCVRLISLRWLSIVAMGGVLLCVPWLLGHPAARRIPAARAGRALIGEQRALDAAPAPPGRDPRRRAVRPAVHRTGGLGRLPVLHRRRHQPADLAAAAPRRDRRGHPRRALRLGLAALAVAAYSVLWDFNEQLDIYDSGLAVHWHLAGMWLTFAVSAGSSCGTWCA